MVERREEEALLWSPFEESRVFEGFQGEEVCELNHCYLPKGHKGLHQVMARIYDIKTKRDE